MPEIKFKRGLEAKLPPLDEAEPGFTTDTEKLFIGSKDGNIQLAKQKDLDTTNANVANNTNALNNLTSTNTNAEVMSARGAYPLLGNRLDNVDTQITTNTSNIAANTSSLAESVHLSSLPRIAPENDDTARLQRAIAQADGKRAIIFDPNATYQLSGTLLINTGVVLIGNGATVTGGSIQFQNTCTYGSVSGFTFNGTTLVTYGDNMDIRNNYFKNQNDNAIAIWQAVDNITIAYNRFENINPATGFYNSSGRAIYQSTTGNVKKLVIAHNKMENIHGGSAIFVSGIHSNLEIYYNNIYYTDGMGIELFQMDISSTGKIEHNTISYIGFLRTSNPSGVGCCGIYNGYSTGSGSVPTISASNNKIDHVYEVGIEGAFGLVQNNTISYTGCDQAGHPTPSIEGIYGALKAIGNTILNPGGHGIRHQGQSASGIVDRVIKGNYIRNDTLNASANGIDIRTQASGQPLQDIVIQDNHCEGFDSAIYLMNNNLFSGIQFKRNTHKNTNNFMKDANGRGINIKEDGLKTYYFQNDMFTSWATTTSLNNWSIANGTLSQVSDGSNGRLIPKVTAVDGNNARLTQKIQTPLLSRSKLLYMEFVVQGSAKYKINVYPVNADNSLNYAGGANYTYDNFSPTTFQTIGLLWGVGGTQFQVEIGTSGVAADWLSIREVKCYLIDKEHVLS